jgi:hypothetical protein
LYRPGQELRNQLHQVIDGQREDAEHQVAERAAPVAAAPAYPDFPKASYRVGRNPPNSKRGVPRRVTC